MNEKRMDVGKKNWLEYRDVVKKIYQLLSITEVSRVNSFVNV